MNAKYPLAVTRTGTD